MEDNWESKIAYLDRIVRPELEAAFKRADHKYDGMEHNPTVKNRKSVDDIRHIHDCHVSVRLREAEDFADLGDTENALNKIESAIGYLVILHRRVRSNRSRPEIEKMSGVKK